MADIVEQNAKIKRVAATALGGHRVVAIVDNLAEYCDNTNPAHLSAQKGITAGACNQGELAAIVVYGPIIETSWNWTTGPLFVGTNGQITATAPATGFVQVIAKVLTNNRIFVDSQSPINRGS